MNQRSAVRLIREEPVGLSDDAFGFGAYAQTLAAAQEAKESSRFFADWIDWIMPNKYRSHRIGE